MSGVLVAFAIIGFSVLAGYLSARFRLLDASQGRLLNRVAFYVFSPALLFAVLIKTDIGTVFSPVLLVLLICAGAIVLLFVLLSRLFFRRDMPATTIGATASTYLNSNNIGLPVSIFVLGDLTYFAPVLVLQLVLFLPIILGLLELARERTSIARSVLGAVLNPLILSSVLGFAVAATGIPIPDVIYEPLNTLGGAAVPLLLFAYGVSLHGQHIWHAAGDRILSTTAIVLKAIVMPALAYVLSALVFRLSPHEVFVATILASLPTAQNIYTYASVYQTKTFAVRDVVFVTTAVSLPIMFIIAALLKA